MRRHVRGFGVLMSFSFKAAPREAALFLLSGALMSLAGPVAAFGAKLLIDAALAHNLNKGLVAALVLALAAGAGVMVTLYYIDFLFSVAEKAGVAVDKRLIDLMAGVPGLAHHETPEYLDKLDLLREQRSSLAWMTNATAGVVRVAVQLVASGILLARLHPVLLLLPLVGVISFVTGRRAQELQQEALEATAESERLRRHLFTMGTSAPVGKELRVFGLTEEIISRHNKIASDVNFTRDRAAWRGATLQLIDALVSGAAYAGAIGLVLIRAVNGSGTPGDVVLAVGLAAGMNAMVFTAVFYGTAFLRVLRVAERYLWLLDYAEAARVRPEKIFELPERLTTGIEIRNLSFSYPGTTAPILTNLSIGMPAGSIVALVGENGAGKSTLVKLLCRYYEWSSGQILVDNLDLRQFPVDAWRARVAAGFQDFMRFELTVGEGVGVGDLSRIHNEPALVSALARAGANDVAERLPRGLETQLGREWESGVELSGGQWQKLALARAMMKDRPLLLILDEPTASLDAQTEHELFERYSRAARESAKESGSIILLVTHRFSTVRMADLIVVLENGGIRESGSHTELMLSGGTYAELYELQARGYR
ncbi:MAG: ABC transporter ATP-binding protein [Chloroflexota bacterium]